MKPSKVLEFSTEPTNLPQLMVLDHHTVKIDDIEYLVNFKSCTALDEGDRALVTFWLHSKSDYSDYDTRLLNEQGIFQLGKYNADHTLKEDIKYMTYKIYPQGELTDYTQYSTGYLLYDYKEKV